jgi:hypothetical protein
VSGDVAAFADKDEVGEFVSPGAVNMVNLKEAHGTTIHADPPITVPHQITQLGHVVSVGRIVGLATIPVVKVKRGAICFVPPAHHRFAAAVARHGDSAGMRALPGDRTLMPRRAATGAELGSTRAIERARDGFSAELADERHAANNTLFAPFATHEPLV